MTSIKSVVRFIAVFSLLGSISVPSFANPLDLSTPEGQLELMKRTQCGEGDGVAATYRWAGRVYARRQGERDKHIFNVEGMNIRQCTTLKDKEKGIGYRQVSREIMLYLDPKTNEVLRTWENPWTGETVDVMHVANDPVNSQPTFPVGRGGRPYDLGLREMNGQLLLGFEVPLYYTNPLAGEYQAYVGNKYHAMEIFDFAMDKAEAVASDTKAIYPSVSWIRLSTWLPWMKMEGREGILVFNAVGAKLAEFDDLPDVLKDEIKTAYPEYTAPPPLDDARPNATTWTEFKQLVDDQRASGKAGR